MNLPFELTLKTYIMSFGSLLKGLPLVSLQKLTGSGHNDIDIDINTNINININTDINMYWLV